MRRLSKLWIILMAAAAVSAASVLAHEVPSTVPPEARAKKNPVPASKASIQAGRMVYEKSCLSCHGPSGRGDGPDAGGLGHRPPSLPKVERRQSDGELFWKITRGGGAMPSYRDSLTEQERWQVIRYLRTLD